MEDKADTYAGVKMNDTHGIAHWRKKVVELDKQLLEALKDCENLEEESLAYQAQLEAAQAENENLKMHLANWKSEYSCDADGCENVVWCCFHCGRSYCDTHGAAERFGEEGQEPRCLKKAQADNARLWEALDTIKHEANHRLNSSKDDTWAIVYNKAREALAGTSVGVGGKANGYV